MDITKWDDTWLKVKWKEDSEDIIKQKIADLYRVGVDFNMKGDCGYGWGPDFVGTPLCFAAGYSTVGVIDLLIDGGADINSVQENGQMPLHWAAHQGKIENVKYLIEHGPKDKASFINVKDNSGWTALHHAIFAHQTEIAKVLIEYGADVNASSRRKETPLMMAANEDCAEIARMLIEHGADMNVKDKSGQTAPFVAAILGHADTLKVLIENGANVDIKREDYAVTLGGMNEAKVRKLLENADKIRADYLKKQSKGSLRNTLGNATKKPSKIARLKDLMKIR